MTPASLYISSWKPALSLAGTCLDANLVTVEDEFASDGGGEGEAAFFLASLGHRSNGHVLVHITLAVCERLAGVRRIGDLLLGHHFFGGAR